MPNAIPPIAPRIVPLIAASDPTSKAALLVVFTEALAADLVVIAAPASAATVGALEAITLPICCVELLTPAVIACAAISPGQQLLMQQLLAWPASDPLQLLTTPFEH